MNEELIKAEIEREMIEDKIKFLQTLSYCKTKEEKLKVYAEEIERLSILPEF